MRDHPVKYLLVSPNYDFEFKAGSTRSQLVRITSTDRPDAPGELAAALRGCDLSLLVTACIYKARFGDADIAPLGKAKNLVRLKFHALSITDDGLRYLADVSKLDTLLLYDLPQVTGAGFSHLRNHPKLRELDFVNVPLSDAGLEQIAQIRGVEELLITRPKVTGVSLAYISRMANLQHLRIIDCAITDADLARMDVSKLIDLREVVIKGPGVTKKGLEDFKSRLRKRD